MSSLKGQFTPYSEMTDEQKREFHSLGGKKAQAKRKENKKLQEYLLNLLASKTNSGDVAGDLCWALIQKALNGDVKAFETIRDSIGEKPKEQVEAVVESNIIKVELEDDE